MTEEGNEQEEVSEVKIIGKVSVRVPPFWKRSPDLWFVQLEAQFHTSGITADITKYFTLIGNLDAEILTEVRDIINSPPSNNKYSNLKERLLQAFQDSEQKRLRKLLSGITLDGRRPTQLFNQMKELAAGSISDDVLKTLWMQQLPQQTQAVLASDSTQNVNRLAEMADKISEVFSNPEISAASRSFVAPSVAELSRQIAALQAEIKQLKLHRRDTSRNRGSLRQRSSSRFKSKNQSTDSTHKICWYHRRFGNAAKRCQ